LIRAIAMAATATPAPTPTSRVLERGKIVYAGACLACHGATGQGAGPVAFAVKPPPGNLAKDPFKGGDSVEQIYATITNGLPNTRMVGYPQIKPADRWALAHYLREFRKRR
jgi:high-affinity iron transporter